MKQQIIYHYLGTNGSISSPVYLEGIYSVKTYMLMADEGKSLTKDNKHFYSTKEVNQTEIDEWYEVNK